MEQNGAKVAVFHESLRWLLDKRANVTSQYGENGIIDAIFEKIGIKNRHCLEVGAADGKFFSNTKGLLDDGWSSVQIEADREQWKLLSELHHSRRDRVICLNRRIESTGYYCLDEILRRYEYPQDIDLIVIDIDGDDLYIANSLINYHPRVLMVEYDPEAISPTFWPDYGSGKQAGWKAVCAVMQKHNAGEVPYVPILRTECNIIFVRQDAIAPLVNQVVAQEILAKQPKEKQEEIRCVAAMTVPRHSSNATWGCIQSVLTHFKMPLSLSFGAFWNQCITRAIERAISVHKATHILTIDHDGLFSIKDVGDLMMALIDNPDVDVVVPMQCKRDTGELLANTDGAVDLSKPLVPINAGHFGLSIFKKEVFDRIEKPWFWDQPGPDGRWEEGRVDADMYGWAQMKKAGINVQMVTGVRLGHQADVASFPAEDGTALYMPVSEWWRCKQRAPKLADYQNQEAASAEQSSLEKAV